MEQRRRKNLNQWKGKHAMVKKRRNTRKVHAHGIGVEVKKGRKMTSPKLERKGKTKKNVSREEGQQSKQGKRQEHIFTRGERGEERENFHACSDVL